MAIFATDSFVGTDGTLIQDHGVSWAKSFNATGNSQLIDDRARQSTTTEAAYQHATTPPSADYEVETVFQYVSGGGSDQKAGPQGRVQGAQRTFYWARYVTGTGYELYKVVNNVSTLLGSFARTLALGQYSIRLRMVGSSIQVFKDADVSPIISVTDSAISGAGSAGFRYSGSASVGDAVGIHIDQFTANDLGVPPDPPTGTITSQPPPDGQSQRFIGETTDATSGTYTLTGSNGGETVGPLPFDVEGDAFDFTVEGLVPGDYVPTLTVTGPGGTESVDGISSFAIVGVSGGGEIDDGGGGGDAGGIGFIEPIEFIGFI